MSQDLFGIENNISNYELELKKARALCIRGQFNRALEIYNSILEDEFDNPDALVGLLRVHSKDFTIYEGDEIEKDIRIIYRLCPTIDDKEFLSYIEKRNQIVKNEYLFNKDNNKVVVNDDIKPIEVTPHYNIDDEDFSKFEEDFLDTNELFNEGKYDECANKYKYWADNIDQEIGSLCAFRYAYCVHDNNPSEALQYYLKSINDEEHIEESIVPHVYYNIAIIYHAQNSGERNIELAVKYMRLAAEKGSENAKERLPIYEKEINPPKADEKLLEEADKLFQKIVNEYQDEKYLEAVNAFTALLEFSIKHKEDEAANPYFEDLANRGTYYLGVSFRRLKEYEDSEKYLNLYIEYGEIFNDDNLRFAYWELAMLYRYDKPDNYENKHQAYLYYSKGAALGSKGCQDGMNALINYKE